MSKISTEARECHNAYLRQWRTTRRKSKNTTGWYAKRQELKYLLAETQRTKCKLSENRTNGLERRKKSRKEKDQNYLIRKRLSILHQEKNNNLGVRKYG